MEPDKDVAAVGLFGLPEFVQDSKGLQTVLPSPVVHLSREGSRFQLYRLYAHRAAELWKDAGVMGWLERNVRALLPALTSPAGQDDDGLLADFRKK